MGQRCRLAASVHAFAIGVSLSVLIVWQSHAARADVIVLANRTGGPLPVRFSPVAGQAQQLMLPVGEVMPLFLDGKAHVEFASPGNPKRYLLDANCAYYFGRAADGRVDLQRIGLGEDGTALDGRSLSGSASRTPTMTIAVKVFVDEEEPARQLHWERRLRRRIEAASAILEQYSRIALRVVDAGTWNSDNATNDFIASLAEFEREAKPFPGRVSIGFTSQWTMVRGRTHMAGTRGPLHTHILVREGSPNISEPEKLEFLVHELGHHLGAAHSPERSSVMRPVLGDNQAGRADFRIQFDPVNTLVIAMIGEEIRRRNITRLYDLTADSKARLRQIYTELAGSLPGDPSGPHYVQLMGSAATMPLAGAAKQVLQEIIRAGVSNAALPMATEGDGGGGQSRRGGDTLTEYYVRTAARAAASLPADMAPRALVAALGIGLGDVEVLAKAPRAGDLAHAVEPSSDRMLRLAVLGEPTMRGRRDLAKHFFVSAYLTATVGAEAANAAGLAKELVDARGGGGLSFADLAANRAGIRFADSMLNNRLPLGMLAHSFLASEFMPAVDGLPEKLSAKEFSSQFGNMGDARFRERISEIDRRIQALPPYRPIGVQFNQ